MKSLNVLAALLLTAACTFAAEAAKPAPAAKTAVCHVKGTVVSVDAVGNVLILKTGIKKDTLNVGSAEVLLNGKKATLADAKEGMQVFTTGTKGAGVCALTKVNLSETKIRVKPAAKDAAKK